MPATLVTPGLHPPYPFAERNNDRDHLMSGPKMPTRTDRPRRSASNGRRSEQDSIGPGVGA